MIGATMPNVLNHNIQTIPPQIQQVKQLMSMVNNASNPQQMIQQLAKNDPQLNQVMQMCKSGNPKDIFYALCKQKGVDPNSILNQLR